MNPRRQLAFTVVWIAGAVLFATGGLSLFRAGASTTQTATPAVVPPVTVAVSANSAASMTGLSGGSGSGATDRLIRSLQQKAVTAQDTPSYTNLANGYMQKARETGDVTYYTLADRAVHQALAINAKDFSAVTTAAWILLARHDFRGAVTTAQQALKVNPYHSDTYGILGDARLELGDYTGATQAYQRMVDLKPGLPSYNRASHIHWLYGETPGAMQLMRLAITAGGGTFSENVAWCQAQLGDDYFFLGAIPAAEQTYQAALRTFPTDHYALSGLGRLYAGQGRYSLAVSFYKKAIAQVPLPQYVIALGDTYAQMGNKVAAKAQYDLVDFIFHLYDVNHINVGIDRALFYADHDRNLPEALRLARAEATWRHDIRTMDILAWAFYKNHDYTDALAAEQQATRLGTRDSGMDFHMGMIYKALGDTANAKSYLQGALLLNPLFDVRQAPVAEATLRQLGSIRPSYQVPNESTPTAGHVSVGVSGQ